MEGTGGAVLRLAEIVLAIVVLTLGFLIIDEQEEEREQFNSVLNLLVG